MKIKAILVDDEPLALEVLESHIAKIDNIEVAAKCNNGIEAFERLRKERFDLMFLDIQMPELSGIELLKTLTDPPKVIFTTAHRKYAIEGYELDVVDYLLKPISFGRFMKSIEKYYKLRSNEKNTVSMSAESSVAEEPFVYVKDDKKLFKVFLKDIIFIESMKDYLKIHTENGNYVTKETISHFEEILPEDRFLRIHRSYIVSVDRITAITTSSIEIGKKELTIGRSYKQSVTRSLNCGYH